MTEINMLEAKTNLTKMIKNLEMKIEDEYVICRNGTPCAMIVPYSKKKKSRVGCCEGKFEVPSFDEWKKMDKEIEEYFDKKAEEF